MSTGRSRSRGPQSPDLGPGHHLLGGRARRSLHRDGLPGPQRHHSHLARGDREGARAARELAYVPQNSAKSLASARYQTHAVVIGSLDGPYYSDLLMGYEDVAARYDQELLLVVADRPRRSRTLADLRARVDGVMIAQMDIPDEEIAALARLIPVVLVGRSKIAGCDGVVSESVDTATELTRHLVDVHMRRKLVFVGDPAQSSDVGARHAGFQRSPHRDRPRPVARAAPASPTPSGAESRRPSWCSLCRPGRMRWSARTTRWPSPSARD